MANSSLIADSTQLIAARIRIIVSDVDGVWTDGKIIYAGDRETKEFNVRDGLGVKLAQRAGLQVAVITSRKSRSLDRRCQELGISEVIQDARSKADELELLLARVGFRAGEACYVGDDLPDLAPMRLCAISACPSDASPEILEAATWKLTAAGGRGAFRELVERLLKARGDWQRIVKEYDRVAAKLPAGT